MQQGLDYLFSTSQHPMFRFARRTRRAFLEFTLPAPAVIIKPALLAYLSVRSLYYFIYRILVCEPLFKGYCTRFGRGLRTDVFVHRVEGEGDLVIGDDVIVDGKCSFIFTPRNADRPTLAIGNRSEIRHNCRFTIGRQISIGDDCLIAAGVRIFDSSGVPNMPASWQSAVPPRAEKVLPVRVGNNVWLGTNCVLYPGVTVGEGAVVAAGSVVMADVLPNTIVAGNPARKVGSLTPAPTDPRHAVGAIVGDVVSPCLP